MVNPSPQTPFNWLLVKQEAIAGLIVIASAAAIGGIGYIAYTVPSKLDHVLSNQEEFRARIVKLEAQGDTHEVRIIKLELRR
jgi:uncharacterized membrane protein YebE (DUF533 family)